MDKPIAIKFGDNDFGNTFRPLMKALTESSFDGSKEELIALINETIFAFYLIHNVHHSYRDYDRDELTRNYLKVSNREVFYGENEVNGFFQNPEKMSTIDNDFYYWYPGQPDIGTM